MEWEFVVKKTLIGSFTIEAETEDEARDKVRDHAMRIIHTNNQSPWTIEVVHENLIGGGEL